MASPVYAKANMSFLPNMSTIYGPGKTIQGVTYYQQPKTPAPRQTTTQQVAAPAPAPTPSGGESSGDNLGELNQQVRNEINSGYDAYFSQLDQMSNTIVPQQRTAMEGIATSQGTQAENTLTSSKDISMAELGTTRKQAQTNQASSLADLADDVRNLFRAGQVFLGARGAGDSSAANQYSYAISKMGNKARGIVLAKAAEIENQIADREFKIKTTYDTELKNIKAQVDEKMMQIAQWFSDAQTQIATMKAQGQIQKGESLASLSREALDFARNQLLMAQQEAANKRSMLDQWAMNNNTTVQGLKTTLASLGTGVSPTNANPGISGNLAMDAGGNTIWNRTGYGYSKDEDLA